VIKAVDWYSYDVTFTVFGASRIAHAVAYDSQGNPVQYDSLPTPKRNGLHNKIREVSLPASRFLCEGCCGNTAEHWANVRGTNDYVPLCQACHKRYDFWAHGCPKGHDKRRWGVLSDGGCTVCRRLNRYRLELRRGRTGTKPCTSCGYGRCRC
jgi:hypothetical protein